MPETAQSSSNSLPGPDATGEMRPTRIPYRVYEHRFYDVEVLFQPGGDVVYHFFPKKGQFEFPFGIPIFGMLMEDACIWAVGRHVRAEADYLDRKTSRFISRANDPDRSLGQPTFYVKIFGVGGRLGAEAILIERYLGRLDTLLARASTECIAGHALERRLATSRWRD